MGPEFQNIPVPSTPEQRALSQRLKEALLKSLGYELPVIDYAALELRVKQSVEGSYLWKT